MLYPAELRAQLGSDSGGYYVSGARRGKEIYDQIEESHREMEGPVGKRLTMAENAGERVGYC